MLMKLTPGDDIPLRLGARLPRPEEKARNIAEMERIAKVLDDLDGEVRWVVNAEAAGGEGRIDPTIQMSDYRGAAKAGVIKDYEENLRVSQAAPRHVWEYYAPGEKVSPYTRQMGSNSYILTEPPTAHEPAMQWWLTEPTDAEVREYFKASATRPRSLLDHHHALMDRRLALRAFLREQRTKPHALRDALAVLTHDAEELRDCIGIDRAAPPADFTAFCRKP
jgi:hypothetical protein